PPHSICGCNYRPCRGGSPDPPGGAKLRIFELLLQSVIPSGAGGFARESSCGVEGPCARPCSARTSRGVLSTSFIRTCAQYERLSGPRKGADKHGVFRLREWTRSRVHSLRSR